jgi:hypothetical protein
VKAQVSIEVIRANCRTVTAFWHKLRISIIPSRILQADPFQLVRPTSYDCKIVSAETESMYPETAAPKSARPSAALTLHKN